MCEFFFRVAMFMRLSFLRSLDFRCAGAADCSAAATVIAAAAAAVDAAAADIAAVDISAAAAAVTDAALFVTFVAHVRLNWRGGWAGR